jgi:hypothetical protein
VYVQASAKDGGAWLKVVRLIHSRFTSRSDVEARALAPDGIVNRLHDLLERHGSLSEHLIERSPEAPHSDKIRRRFGTLETAYRLGATRLYARKCWSPHGSVAANGNMEKTRQGEPERSTTGMGTRGSSG